MTTFPTADPFEDPPPDSPWAKPVTHLPESDAPAGAINLNVGGRQVHSPLQGFGQLWQKTYRVRLPGVTLKAPEVMKLWKDEFASFQPPESHFHPPSGGMEPGSIVFIDLALPVAPGLPNAIPVASGVMVLYADDVSMTVMTPQGFPVSGWNTFSIEQEEDGCLVAQVQSMERATDPIYEVGNLLMGGARRQEENWKVVLTKLAARLGVYDQPVETQRRLVDNRRQWSEARNVWYNAGVRTALYQLAAPYRYVRDQRGEGAGPPNIWALVLPVVFLMAVVIVLLRLLGGRRRS